MEQLQTLLQDRWYILIGAIVVLFIVMKVVKTVVKWVIIIAVLVIVFGYGASYIGDIKAKVTDQALQVISSGGKDAVYKKNEDGTFTITAKNITLVGKPGSNDVKVKAFGQSVTLKIDQTLQTFIDQAKKTQ